MTIAVFSWLKIHGARLNGMDPGVMGPRNGLPKQSRPLAIPSAMRVFSGCHTRISLRGLTRFGGQDFSLLNGTYPSTGQQYRSLGMGTITIQSLKSFFPSRLELLSCFRNSINDTLEG